MVVTELCRKHGMLSATYYAEEAKFGGLEVFDVSGSGRSTEESAQPKRLLVDTMLDHAGLEGLLSKKS